MDRHENAGFVDFLEAEVKTGLTFSSIAATSSDEEKMRRNQANARKAYDSILHFIEKAQLTSDEITELKPKIAQLQRELQALGEPGT